MEQAVLETRLQKKVQTLPGGVTKPYLANLMLTGAEALEKEVSSINHDMMLATILMLQDKTDQQIVTYLGVGAEAVLQVVEQIQTEEDLVENLLMYLLWEAITEHRPDFPAISNL